MQTINTFTIFAVNFNKLNMTVKGFNIEEALNGASIGFTSYDAEGKLVVNYIIDFKPSNTGKKYSEYSGISSKDNKKYYFNSKGECEDGKSEHLLYRIVDEIIFTEGTAGSRGDAEEGVITIDYMQPRDQFALSAMQSIINKIDGNILGIDDFKIGVICDLSYKIAQKMMDTSAKYRELAEGEETESPYIEIKKTDVTENTDKILYNIQTVLKGG